MLEEVVDYALDTARESDRNGYMLVRNNPIIRAGVFQYKGEQLPGGQPGKIYGVYRPLDELTKPETLQSFVGLPIINDHEMLGDVGKRGAEEKGVHGATLENITVDGLDVNAPLRFFSRTMRDLMNAGKKGLSLGYKCRFEKSSGTFNGIAYHYIQRDIRGNHLALVLQGRNGTDVLDENDIALDTEELNMADEKKETGEKDLDKKTSDDKKTDAQDTGTATDKKDGTAEDASVKKDDEKSEKSEEKKEAMDAADVTRLVNDAIAKERSTISKTLMGDITARNQLAKDLEPQIGTFACDAMDIGEVAAYGAEKLGLNFEKGTEVVAVQAYLAGLKKGGEGKVTYAMDSAANIPQPKAGGKLAQTIATRRSA